MKDNIKNYLKNHKKEIKGVAIGAGGVISVLGVREFLARAMGYDSDLRVGVTYNNQVGVNIRRYSSKLLSIFNKPSSEFTMFFNSDEARKISDDLIRVADLVDSKQ
jgi:hypothetical protein